MRRAFTIIGATGLALLLLGVLAWTLRLSIAEHVLRGYLAEQGYPRAALEVTALGPTGATIETIALAPPDGPRARRLDVTYRPRDLLARNPANASIALVGARLRHDFAAARAAPAAGDAADAAGLRGLAAKLTALQRVSLDDARVAIETRHAAFNLILDGTLRGGGDGGPTGEFSGRLDRGDSGLIDPLDVTLAANGLRIQAATRPVAGLDSMIDFQVDGLHGHPAGRIDYRIEATPEAFSALARDGLPVPTEGTVTVAGAAGGELRGPPAPGLAQLADWLAAGGWSGSFSVSGDGLARGERLTGVDIRATGAWQAADDGIGIELAGDGAIDVAGIATDSAAFLPVPGPVRDAALGTSLRIEWPAGEIARLSPGSDPAATIEPRLSIRWPERSGRLSVDARATLERARDGAGPRPTLRALALELRDFRHQGTVIERLRANTSFEPDAERLAGDIALSASLPEVRIGPLGLAAVRADGRLRLRRAGDGLHFTLEPGSTLTAGRAWLGERARTATPWRGAITAGHFRIGDDPDWSLGLDVEPARLRVAVGGDAPRDIELDAHHLDLTGPSALHALERARIERASLRVPDFDLAADGLSATLAPARIEDWLTFELAALTAERRDIAALRLSGSVAAWSDEGYILRGGGDLAAGAAAVELAGRAPADAGSGRITLAAPEIAFAPDGLQPADLLPALSAIEQARGTTGVRASLRWDEQGLAGDGLVAIEGLDFSIGPARVAGLRGDIELAGLRPPRTAAAQRLAAAAIDVGARIEQARLRYRLRPGPGRTSTIEIERGSGRLAGGYVTMPPATIDPAASTHVFDIEVADVRLAPIADALAIDALAIDGTASGRLPFSLVDGQPFVREARLTARDGRVRFRPGEIDAADTEVPLALRAFADLDYSTMEFALDHRPGREGRIRIDANGTNPAVRDGAPLDLGVEIGGTLAPLFRAVGAGRPLARPLLDANLRAVEGSD